jgi:antagonist of KipI
MFSVIQDLGRPGFGSIGVPAGGAADHRTHRILNRIIGNTDAAATIEMTLIGLACTFEHHATACIGGGDAAVVFVSQDGREVRMTPWTAFSLRPGDQLRCGRIEAGARLYLAVGGGITVPMVLGSASTLPGGRIGGYLGRALQKGDRLQFEGSRPQRAERKQPSPALSSVANRGTIRAVAGCHAAMFPQQSVQAFWSTSFAISARSNRVGIRLEGAPVANSPSSRLASEGMCYGAVEVPGDGLPIILGVDYPTTGGYPVIACVIEADLPLLGQLSPGDVIRFTEVSLDAARAASGQSLMTLDREFPPR